MCTTGRQLRIMVGRRSAVQLTTQVSSTARRFDVSLLTGSRPGRSSSNPPVVGSDRRTLALA
jgi:hypothetical protein